MTPGPRACPDCGQSPDGQPQGVAPTVDLYERIRNRSTAGRRFSTQTTDSAGRSCPSLNSLKRELNIPDEVLASLTPAEIRRITAQSKANSQSDTPAKDEKPHD